MRIFVFVVAGSLCFLSALRMLAVARVLAEGCTWSMALWRSRSRMVTRTADPVAYWASVSFLSLYTIIQLVAAAFILGNVPGRT